MSHSYRGSGSACYHPTAAAEHPGVWLRHRRVFQPQAGAGDVSWWRFASLPGNEHPDHDTIADIPASLSETDRGVIR